MQTATKELKRRHWLSLGEACGLLEINEATLRHWADDGRVQSFRTPGGHRRFSREDIDALIDGGRRHPSDALTTPVDIDVSVRQQIRRRLSGARLNTPGWHTGFDESGRERMRELGGRLVSLCVDSLSHKRQGEALAAARVLGQEYAQEAASRSVSIPDTVQAFTFFRNAVLDAIKEALVRSGISTHDLGRCWHQLNRLTDEALLSLTRGYQRIYEKAVPSKGKSR
jgi:excisionase family DNA binding protein